eukprot:7461401-Pyramimonas_sp.AAC.1
MVNAAESGKIVMKVKAIITNPFPHAASGQRNSAHLEFVRFAATFTRNSCEVLDASQLYRSRSSSRRSG